MNIAGVIILYYPLDDILDKIKEYSKYLDAIYICDNTERPDIDLIEKIRLMPKIQYFYDGENKGIGLRLNVAAKRAIEEGFDVLLTMDQDSYLNHQTFKKYINCVSAFKNFNTVSMFGLEYVKERINKSEFCVYEEIFQTITSGSLLNLALIKEIGFFNEDYFIDFVDSEFCYRSIKKGYKIILLKNIFLEHNLGEVKFYKSLKTFKTTPRSLHSALRIYYMTRNYFYLKKDYENLFRENLKLVKKDVLTRTKNNLLYRNERIKLLYLLMQAYIDFKRNKTGKKK